jgi:beta-hydroxylase
VAFAKNGTRQRFGRLKDYHAAAPGQAAAAARVASLHIHVELKYVLIAAFLAMVLFVHFRGRVRHPFFRKQIIDHSAFFAPYNILAYAFSAVPLRPFIETQHFPQLVPLRDNWSVLREEALQLLEQGHVGGGLRHEDAGFASFYGRGWKRFHLKWYGQPLPSARALCPRTVQLLEGIPSVKAAMFACLSPGGKLTRHRDPFAGSLRYHLGLVTPNSDACRILVDGEPYSWRDGEGVVFDETYIHEAENLTDKLRIILFCDIDRPLHTKLMRAINHGFGIVLGRATAVRNVEGEPLGVVNRVYFIAHHTGNLRRRLKHANRTVYRAVKIALALLIVYLLIRW